ncbi:hypothetical protein DXG01_015471 [Tephrocybe rancida]|nr:hypothetical protein DXG01_015471 [Tephrocybe rancida]
MPSPPVYTTLNVPTVTSYPSIKCLQWSADGQACFATKTAAYILTPDHGVHFDASSSIKSVKEREDREGIPSIGWFRTIIPFEKSDLPRWPEYSQAWGAASLGSIDVALWDVTFSPSGLSPESGCILAGLTSNMDLTLWTAAKNCLKGEWIKVCEVTPFLLETFAGDTTSAGQTAQALNSQITCISWSPQADFGLIPTPHVDGSLLIAGNRAGSLVLLRSGYMDNACGLFFVDPGKSRNMRVVFRVAHWALLTETWQSYDKDASPDPPELSVVCEASQKTTQPDNASITALLWVEVPRKGRVLVHCKPGRLNIWCHPTPDLGWSGFRSFRLQTQKLSVGSSSLHPASSIQYVVPEDIIILTLFDGSFHVVYDISGEPTMTPPTDDTLVSSESLSQAVRSVFVQSEQDVDTGDMNRITGLASYDSSSTFIWIQEASRPSDFSYKHDAKHNSTLLVSNVWNDSDDEALVRELEVVLNGAKTSAGLAPLHLLRPFFFRLREREKLLAFYPQILQILKPQLHDHSVLVDVPTWTSMTPELRQIFRTSLVQHLFGWDVLFSLRMRLSMADFVWKYVANEEKQTECGHVAQDLLNTISHRVLRTIIRHLAAAVNLLTPNDIPFVLRMVVQSLLPGSPEDLSAEGNKLQAISQAAVHPNPQETPVTNSFNELCPACGVEVLLEDITTAVCTNGHTWARCSITTFILSTPLVRTCVGCSRKAFLPLSTPNTPSHNWLPEAARGWVVEELLEAVHRCLFCNNSFVNVL